jgi:hypothetical protein
MFERLGADSDGIWVLSHPLERAPKRQRESGAVQIEAAGISDLVCDAAFGT